MALSAMCFSIPSSFNLYHTLLLALVSVIAFTCSSCALLIYWAPCPIVFAGSLSFPPLLSLPVDVAEYVFLSPCLVGLVSLSCLCVIEFLFLAHSAWSCRLLCWKGVTAQWSWDCKLQSVRCARKRYLTRDIAESVRSQILIQIWKSFSNVIIWGSLQRCFATFL